MALSELFTRRLKIRRATSPMRRYIFFSRRLSITAVRLGKRSLISRPRSSPPSSSEFLRWNIGATIGTSAASKAYRLHEANSQEACFGNDVFTGDSEV